MMTRRFNTVSELLNFVLAENITNDITDSVTITYAGSKEKLSKSKPKPKKYRLAEFPKDHGKLALFADDLVDDDDDYIEFDDVVDFLNREIISPDKDFKINTLVGFVKGDDEYENKWYDASGSIWSICIVEDN
jgi:hypothetical protein